MNALLRKALAAVEALPSERQEKIAEVMLDLARGDASAATIDPAHLDDVMAGLDQACRGEFASDAEVEAALRRFG